MIGGGRGIDGDGDAAPIGEQLHVSRRPRDQRAEIDALPGDRGRGMVGGVDMEDLVDQGREAAGLRLDDVGVVLDLLGRPQPLQAERLGRARQHGERRPELVRDVEHEVRLELRQANRFAVHADRADDRDQQQADDGAEQPEARRRRRPAAAPPA